MKIWFAGCVKDCAHQLPANIAALLRIAEDRRVKDLRVYLLENDSSDNTKTVIKSLAANDERIVPIFLDNCAHLFSTREARLAYCRDHLLNLICEHHNEGLYCPVDLDLDLASPMAFDPFLVSCELVLLRHCSAIFPSSFPYYYDVSALRAKGWCLTSCWKDVEDFQARGELLSLLARIWFVYRLQRHYLDMQRNETHLIPVKSAFGGIGIYSLATVAVAKARYSLAPSQCQDQCEHVAFNSYFSDLYIDTRWIILAPVEHIRFRLLPPLLQLTQIILAAFSDAKQLALRLLMKKSLMT